MARAYGARSAGLVDDAAEEVEWLIPITLRIGEYVATRLLRGEDPVLVLTEFHGTPEVMNLLGMVPSVLVEVQSEEVVLLSQTRDILALLGSPVTQ